MIAVSDAVISALIGIISGGSIAGIISLILTYRSNKQKEENERKYNEEKRRAEKTDSRVTLLQELSEKNDKKYEEAMAKTEDKLNKFEQKLAMYDRDFVRMERYIIQLTQALIDSGVKIDKLPERPALEKDKIL